MCCRHRWIHGNLEGQVLSSDPIGVDRKGDAGEGSPAECFIQRIGRLIITTFMIGLVARLDGHIRTIECDAGGSIDLIIDRRNC